MSEVPILPPAPPTVVAAIVSANDLAYGFEKHQNDGYWNALYASDPEYAWKRMLGWQAGGDDVAKFGLYANPVSPWHGSPVVPPVPPVPDPVPDVLVAILTKLNDIEVFLLQQAGKPAPTPPDYQATVRLSLFGTSTFTLTPKKG